MMRRIELPFTVKNPILACGADLKGAFAFAKGREASLVDGFGDLSDPDNLDRYEAAIRKWQKKLKIKPSIVACDLHPGYFSSKVAESFQLNCDRAHLSGPYCCQLYKVQHHEAHVAAAIVDNSIKGKVIGVAFDGTGYGLDGNIWGGEFFVGDLKGLRRAAHLGYVAMPGGEKAIEEPWRMAASYLYKAFGDRLPGLAKKWPAYDLAILKSMIDKGVNSPLTSSAGRLFDGVGSLVLGKDRVSKEAELPIELEKLVKTADCKTYGFNIRQDSQGLIIEEVGIIKGVVKDLSSGMPISVISCRFHNTIAEIILRTAIKLSRKFKTKNVVLTGGVFQNKYLTMKAAEVLTAGGLKVYTHHDVSTNDSGIPVGQIAIANARATCV